MSKTKRTKESESLETTKINVDKLSDNEKTNLIYNYSTQIKQLENELESRNNPISLLSDNADNMISLIKETAENWLAIKKTNLGFSLKMAIFAFLTVGLIVGSAAWLTYIGKIDGSTFTFLLGLIVGYALTFLQNLISPPN